MSCGSPRRWTAGLGVGAALALADPVPFTWNPAGAIPALGGSAFTADTIVREEFLS